jgi:hypothetical protein
MSTAFGLGFGMPHVAKNAGAAVAPTDPYIANVVFGSSFEGANAGTTFIDWSTYGRAISITGSGVTTSTTNPKFGASAANFTNAGGLVVSNADNVLNLGTGDFTIEGWFYKATGGGGTDYALYWGPSSNVSWLYVRPWGGNAVALAAKTDTGLSGSNTINSIADNAWHSFAITRTGNSVYFFIDGVLVLTTGASTGNFNPGPNFTLGCNVTGGSLLTGQIDEIRVTKGVARYTSNYTPPVAAFPRS